MRYPYCLMMFVIAVTLFHNDFSLADSSRRLEEQFVSAKTPNALLEKVGDFLKKEEMEVLRIRMGGSSNLPINIEKINGHSFRIRAGSMMIRYEFLGVHKDGDLKVDFNNKTLSFQPEDHPEAYFQKFKQSMPHYKSDSVGLTDLLMPKAEAIGNAGFAVLAVAAVATGITIGIQSDTACKALGETERRCRNPAARSLTDFDQKLLIYARDYLHYRKWNTLLCEHRSTLEQCLKAQAAQLKADIGIEGIPRELRSVFGFPDAASEVKSSTTSR